MATYKSYSSNSCSVGQNCVITKPSGVIVGDVLLAHVVFYGEKGNIELPSGWSQILTREQRNEKAIVRLSYKIVDDADLIATDYTFYNLYGGNSRGAISCFSCNHNPYPIYSGSVQDSLGDIWYNSSSSSDGNYDEVLPNYAHTGPLTPLDYENKTAVIISTYFGSGYLYGYSNTGVLDINSIVEAYDLSGCGRITMSMAYGTVVGDTSYRTNTATAYAIPSGNSSNWVCMGFLLE